MTAFLVFLGLGGWALALWALYGISKINERVDIHWEVLRRMDKWPGEAEKEGQ